MKQLILYYSYTGNTKAYAQELAATLGADLCQVQEVKRKGTLAAYTAGCIQAMGCKQVPIKPLEAELAGYDRIILAAPVWASRQAPAINSAIGLLPAGKEVALHLVSASGGGKSDKMQALVEQRGCTVTEVKLIKK